MQLVHNFACRAFPLNTPIRMKGSNRVSLRRYAENPKKKEGNFHIPRLRIDEKESQGKNQYLSDSYLLQEGVINLN